MTDPLKGAGGLPAALHYEIGTLTQTAADAAPWQEELQALHPFPVDALSPAVRKIVEAVADVYGVPVELPAACALGFLSGALGKSYVLTGAVNGSDAHGNLFLIVAAPKSSGKGSVAHALAGPLIEASKELEERYRTQEAPGLKAEQAVLVKQEAALSSKLANGKTGKGGQTWGEVEQVEAQREMEGIHARLAAIQRQMQTTRSYWMGNSTSEALAANLKSNPSGLLCYSPEAGETVRVMLGKYRKDNAADLDLFLSGYSVEPCRFDRIGREPCNIIPCLSMLLLVQPSILSELAGHQEVVDRGLLARMLICNVKVEPQEDDGVTRNVSAETERDWRQLFRGILKRRETLANEPHRIRCSPEAREVFRRFYNETVKLRRGQYREVEADLARWRENAIRIAVNLCVADDPESDELSETQAVRAVRIMQWFASQVLWITNAKRLQQQERRMQELCAVLEKRGGRATLRDLDRHGFSKEEVKDFVKAHQNKFALYESSPKVGRPSCSVRLLKM